MVGVHKDVGGGLPHPLPYGGRDDGVQECFVCSLLFKSVGSSCLCKLSHSFRHCGANTEQGGGRGGGVGVAWGVGEVILRIKYTPGTAGGPGGRDRTPAVKSLKKINFFS